MKNKNKLINVMMAVCLVLTLVGCDTTMSATTSSVEMMEDYASIDLHNSAVQNTNPSITDVVQSDFVEETDVAEVPDTTDTTEYPSIESILATIDDGQSRVYWVANDYEVPGSLNVISVNTSDMNDVWASISGILGVDYFAQDVLTSGFSITSDNLDVNAVINALTQSTGMEYVETTNGIEFSSKYVPTIDGYCVDSEGYSSGNNGDYVAGSYVGIRDNSSVYVSMPISVNTVQDTVDASDLISLQNVEALCSAYYENYGIPSVVVVESVELGYYYSNANQQLRPAWICQTTSYMSSNGHADSVMIDAITGEMLRK